MHGSGDRVAMTVQYPCGARFYVKRFPCIQKCRERVNRLVSLLHLVSDINQNVQRPVRQGSPAMMTDCECCLKPAPPRREDPLKCPHGRPILPAAVHAVRVVRTERFGTGFGVRAGPSE